MARIFIDDSAAWESADVNGMEAGIKAVTS
jgi:hypothetical protein